MTTWQRVAGDVGDTITVTLGGIANLDAVSAAEAHVWQDGGTATVLDAEVADAEACTVTVHLGGTGEWLPTATPGRYRLEHQLTFLDGSVLTWPQMRPDEIVVRSQGD
jgi:hypothetical protein